MHLMKKKQAGVFSGLFRAKTFLIFKACLLHYAFNIIKTVAVKKGYYLPVTWRFGFAKMFIFCCLMTVLWSCNSAATGTGTPYGKPAGGTAVAASEKSEFVDLMRKDGVDKDHETAEVLTYLLNSTDPDEPYTAAVIENPSDCDIIFRMVEINSGRIYNLPVARRNYNQFKIAKGNYTMRANICQGKFYSQERVTEPLIIKLKKL